MTRPERINTDLLSRLGGINPCNPIDGIAQLNFIPNYESWLSWLTKKLRNPIAIGSI